MGIAAADRSAMAAAQVALLPYGIDGDGRWSDLRRGPGCLFEQAAQEQSPTVRKQSIRVCAASELHRFRERLPGRQPLRPA